MLKILELIILFLIFFSGSIMASFVNSLVYRLKYKKPFLFVRSVCPFCQHQLSFLDLIPIFSYLFLKTKCRYCQKRISFHYFISEIILGFLFLAVFFLNFKYSQFIFNPDLMVLKLLKGWLLVTVSYFIFIYDLFYFEVEERVILGASFLIFALNTFINPKTNNFFDLILAGIFGVLFFLIQFLITKGKGLGLGDVYLGLFLGVSLGVRDLIIALTSAYILGMIVSFILLALKKKTLKDKIALGPFLALGALLAYFL